MKKILSALALLSSVGVAQAAATGFNVDPISMPFVTTGNAFSGVMGTSTGVFGTLNVDGLAEIKFEYVGQESNVANTFTVGGTTYAEAPFSVNTLENGALDFTFTGAAPASASNGDLLDGTLDPSFIIFGYDGAGDQEVFIGYNDSFAGSDKDFDDYVVKVSFVTAVPEPSTYALMIAGLGAVGFVARRRRA